MTRSFAIAMLAFAVFVAGWTYAGVEKGKDFVVKGKLSKDDPKDTRGGPAQVHKIFLKAGNVYTIDMVSKEMDSYLRLLDPKGKQLDEDDDSGGDLNSRIVFNCNTDGNYQIVTTTFAADQMGNYVLTVKTAGGVQKPQTAHVNMIGKAAPDFKADFAINGDAAKLSDLKGKNVLLYFWDVRSSACTDLLPEVAKWNSNFKKNGLTVVGVTFYTYEIGQKLAWDKEEAKIVTAKKADRDSDQRLIKAFAEHHKIDHPLWVLTKAEALTAYDAYVVNGVPQVVLIDTEGMVRHIDVNGKKGADVVEAELKKVLTK